MIVKYVLILAFITSYTCAGNLFVDFVRKYDRMIVVVNNCNYIKETFVTVDQNIGKEEPVEQLNGIS